MSHSTPEERLESYRRLVVISRMLTSTLNLFTLLDLIFVTALEGRVPENTLLSHDLFEGLYARPALVTDIEVVDDYPSSVLAHARRQHRWVRGDWQILWRLFPFVPTPSGLRRTACRSSPVGRSSTT